MRVCLHDYISRDHLIGLRYGRMMLDDAAIILSAYASLMPDDALTIHLVEEIIIALGMFELVGEEFHRIDRAHLHENAA